MDTLSNSEKHPCSTPDFSVSGLLHKQSLNQSEIQKNMVDVLGVRQCGISLYFTYLSAVNYAIFDNYTAVKSTINMHILSHF